MSKVGVQYRDVNLQEIHNDHIEIVHGHYDDHHTHSEKTRMNENSSLESGGETFKPIKREKIEPYNYNDLMIAYMMEFICCVVFMLIENYAQGDLNKLIFGLYVLITTVYPVCGCNMNGCVSLSLWWYEEEFVKVQIIRRFGYILVIQPLGMFVGQMLSLAVVGPDLIYTKYNPNVSNFTVGFSEFFWTGALVFTALHGIVSRYTRPTNQIGLNFAFFFAQLYFVSSIGGAYNSGCYNPTKFLITNAIAYVRGIETRVLERWYAYVIPEYIGTIAFTVVFKFFFEPLYYRMLTLKYKWEDSFYQEKYL